MRQKSNHYLNKRGNTPICTVFSSETDKLGPVDGEIEVGKDKTLEAGNIDGRDNKHIHLPEIHPWP